MQLNLFLWVGAGGAIGSMLRYAVALAWGNKNFPFATLTVNIIGSLVIGLLFGLAAKNNLSDNQWKLLATGICGGFTTFSALSLEGVTMLQQQRFLSFSVYFLLSLTLGVAATFLGYQFTK